MGKYQWYSVGYPANYPPHGGRLNRWHMQTLTMEHTQIFSMTIEQIEEFVEYSKYVSYVCLN